MEKIPKGVSSKNGDSENFDAERACIFCKIAEGEILAEKVYESENFLVIKDISPFTQGHSLVISKKHYETLLDIPNSLFREYLEVTKEATAILLKDTNSEGFNLIMNNFKAAQQEVPHAHIHIVPRKTGDGKFKFLKK